MLDKNKHLLQFSRCASLSYKAYLLFIYYSNFIHCTNSDFLIG